MTTQNPNEIWQVEVGGQVYEAAFAELGEWIGEGSLLPEDKVRKGNLRWIEARRVPNLIPFFNAKEQGLAMPIMVSTTEADAAPPEIAVEQAVENFQPAPPPVIVPDPIEYSIAVPPIPAAIPDPNFCALHSDIPSVYSCDGCGLGFCKVCPKAYGGVRICSLCGAMCRMMNEVVQKRTDTDRRTAAIDKGFGTEDFFSALAHPFKFKPSLIFGAIMFALFSLGQSVTALGGMYMFVSAIFCLMLANTLSFGVLANTIDKFAHGDVEANFMPSFDDFELWDDVIHPLFLSIAAYVSAFAPFALVMLIGYNMVVSNVNSQMDKFQQTVEKIPGSDSFDTKRTLDQSEAVKKALSAAASKHNEELEAADNAAHGGVAVPETEDVSARETREQEALWAQVQDGRKQELEAAVGKSPETKAKENEALVQNFLALAAPLVVIGGIFFLWGLFYFPAACAVAGYTRSFTATINPLVGLDTIKRLGGTYAKMLLMGFVLLVASTVVGMILGAVFSPLDLPGLGNLPAKFIGAIFGFYLWTVFSCVLGYALFKKSDKLNIA
ncbi:MAG: hypothetical protein DMF63_13105 [Acidobacteria bacterium]|nr:MAG: hypothetical protein DMF63_13105 [Acidobacteriota bacterium]